MVLVKVLMEIDPLPMRGSLVMTMVMISPSRREVSPAEQLCRSPRLVPPRFRLVAAESRPESLLMIFLRTKDFIEQKMGTGGPPGGPRGRGAPRGVGRASHPRGSLVSFPDCFLFSYFLKYSKTEKNCHQNYFGVGSLTVPHTYSFPESETFQKMSLMYSSGVTVSITLVSTFMGYLRYNV